MAGVFAPAVLFRWFYRSMIGDVNALLGRNFLPRRQKVPIFLCLLLGKKYPVGIKRIFLTEIFFIKSAACSIRRGVKR